MDILLQPPSTAVAVECSSSEARWLELFYRGDRATLEDCYRNHFASLRRSLGMIVSGADQETVIHDVFSNLVAREDLRRAYRGGSFVAWLTAVARNRAFDYRRKFGREVGLRDHDGRGQVDGQWEQMTQARLLIEQFRETCLPHAWHDVFELRFLHQLPQREAAQRLGLHRTTLAYRELRIRVLLRSFLLDPVEL